MGHRTRTGSGGRQEKTISHDGSPSAMAPFISPQPVNLAWKRYQAGDLQQAEQICRQIVQADGSQFDALHLLGLIAARTGRDDLARDYLDAAVRLKPDFADAHNILGIVLVKQGKLAEAMASFGEAMRQAGRCPGARQPGQCPEGAGRSGRGGGQLPRGHPPQAGFGRGVQ